MTELEQQLTNALTALSKQYEAEMEQQAEWAGEWQEQVQRLEEIGQGLEATARADRSVSRGFEGASQAIGSGLQGDRRSVARGVNVIWKRQQQRERQRGPERDFGPNS